MKTLCDYTIYTFRGERGVGRGVRARAEGGGGDAGGATSRPTGRVPLTLTWSHKPLYQQIQQHLATKIKGGGSEGGEPRPGQPRREPESRTFN